MSRKSCLLCSSEAFGALLLASGLAMVGCGGGGGGGDRAPLSSPTPVPGQPAGFWKGALTSTNPAEAGAAVAIIAPDGAIRIITEAGFQ